MPFFLEFLELLEFVAFEFVAFAVRDVFVTPGGALSGARSVREVGAKSEPVPTWAGLMPMESATRRRILASRMANSSSISCFFLN